MERIGLIAGGGQLPIIFANEARKKGVKVIGFAIKQLTSPDIGKACDRIHWLSLETGQIKKFVFLLVVERIKKIAMLGKVEKSVIYNFSKENQEDLNLVKGSMDKKDYAILDRVTSEFKKRGIEVIKSVEYLSNLLPSKGVLTKRRPSEKEQDDITFGFTVAKDLSRLDVGQTVVVKDRAVVSIEAMEGTDRTIGRAREIAGVGFVVVKVSRPEQNMRWDVPVVGPETVTLIAENGGKVLAIEEKKMFLVEKETCVKIADDTNISIVVI